MAAKMGVNDFCEEPPIDSADTLVGLKFCQNSSMSYRLQDKCVFTFYAEIQDGCQKWGEMSFRFPDYRLF